MYRNKIIALVAMAFNEEKLIGKTLASVPDLVDKVYVVDDFSPDNQNEVIESYMKNDDRIVLLKHEKNMGPGQTIITGYIQSSKDGNDITVVTGGDFQMPLDEIPNLLDPVIDGKADYAKGNRFMPSVLKDTLEKMPKTRLIPNWIITALAKFCSGYYKIADFVDGFTAITKTAIDTIDWEKAWKGYGYPMDFLIRMNGYGFKTVDVPRTAIYLKGERQSQINGIKYFFKVTPMLIRNFFWRINYRYFYLDFHPLVLFYYLSFVLLLGGVFGSCYLLLKQFYWYLNVSGPQAILCSLLLIMGTQFLLFAMFFDMEEGKNN